MAIKNIFVLLAILFNHVSAWRSAPSTSSFTRYSSKLRYSVGIDVGTGSARCGVFDLKGKMMGSASKAIATYQPKGMPELYEQSSENIWSSVCGATREAIAASGVKPSEITGIGFDATCSLVCLGDDDTPRSVDPVCGTPDRNIIVWLDHRAKQQADKINSGGHKALRTVGGVISLEMEVPKLLWLKENMPEKWLDDSEDPSKRFSKFFDLPDYLVYRATGDDTRSLCSAVCKWNYNALNRKRAGWDKSFLKSINMEDLITDPKTIGVNVKPPGEPVGNGLLKEAAEELGLSPGTPVGVSIIDAHAGGLGVLGAMPAVTDGNNELELRKEIGGRMALIAGTSACHMLTSHKPVFVRGVWGPYKSAMIPNTYLNEAGQSAAGKLLDHVTTTHAAFKELVELATEAGHEVAGRDGTPYAFLNDHLFKMAKKQGLEARDVGMLTKDIHVYPDFFGNRSPLGDPTMRGNVMGLGQTAGVDDLALLYLATLQSLAYQTKHILDACEEAGHEPIHTIFITGGLVANPLYLQAHADITGCVVEIAAEPEAVLLGAAVLGARASGAFPDVPSAMKAMNRAGSTILPYDGKASNAKGSRSSKLGRYHYRKYLVFRSMINKQLMYKDLMNRSYEKRKTKGFANIDAHSSDHAKEGRLVEKKGNKRMLHDFSEEDEDYDYDDYDYADEEGDEGSYDYEDDQEYDDYEYDGDGDSDYEDYEYDEDYI